MYIQRIGGAKLNIAIIFAGGVGTRFSHTSTPKQFVNVNNKPIIIHTLDIFERHDLIDKIYIAIHKDYRDYMVNLVKKYKISKVKGIVNGGITAQHSIYNALTKARSQNSGDAIVLIHDGVRPIVDYNVITENINQVKKLGNSITFTPCYETILISKDGKIPKEIPYRRNTYSAQAPQCFYLDEIIQAHLKIQNSNPNYDDMVDQCTIMHTLGIPVHLCRGNFGNIKVTTPRDIFILEALLKYRKKEQNGLFRCDK